MRGTIAAVLLIAALTVAGTGHAQKRGGILTLEHIDNPPSPSIQEEATASVVIPFMPLFNNLVIYDQHVVQNSLGSIVPELATGWKWNEAMTDLTFTLREGVKWHDGRPFTAADVKCTWDMISGLEKGKIRKSPRQAWFANLESITTNGEHEATFHLKRPQPSMLALLAAGWSPVYPCHVSSAAMRAKPIGTGPFKFVEFRQNEIIRMERNPDYWKPDLPYLDGIEYRIISSRSTRMLAFIAGKFDMSYPTDISVALLKDIRSQAPQAQCVMRPSAVSTNLIINRDAPPFDNPDIRSALALTLDRRAFITLMSEGEARIGASMLPQPEGVWGMPQEMLQKLPGYDPDVAKNREAARALMRKAGYGPDKHLRTKVFTRDLPAFRDAAVILVDQLREIWIDSDLDVVDTTLYYNRVFKKDYSIGLNLTGNSVDDPDQNFYENYGCGSLRNYTNYCNADLQKLYDQQSVETDMEKRKGLVWDIESKLIEDVARPIIMHNKAGACWQPYVKNVSIMVNSIYNGWRFEDIWLDK
jgi:peptide/nickel transport system substrate-binding protein